MNRSVTHDGSRYIVSDDPRGILGMVVGALMGKLDRARLDKLLDRNVVGSDWYDIVGGLMRVHDRDGLPKPWAADPAIDPEVTELWVLWRNGSPLRELLPGDELRDLVDQACALHIETPPPSRPRTVTHDGTRFVVSDDPEQIIARVVSMLVGNFDRAQLDALLARDGDGLGYSTDTVAGLSRADHRDDLPEPWDEDPAFDPETTELWSLARIDDGMKWTVLSGDELRELVDRAYAIRVARRG